MNKIIFVGIGIAIILLIVGTSSIMNNTSLPTPEIDSVEESTTDSPTEGKELSISFSDGISAVSP